MKLVDRIVENVCIFYAFLWKISGWDIKCIEQKAKWWQVYWLANFEMNGAVRLCGTDWLDNVWWAMIYRLVCWSWHLVWIKLNYTLSRLCWQGCSYLYVMKEWKKKQSVVIVLHLVCLLNETENCGKKNGSIITAHICSISILLLHVETNSSFFINELHV